MDVTTGFFYFFSAVLLFAALAGVMYATRNVDWSNVGKREAAG